MTEPPPLFRQEALEFWTRQRGPGAVVRIAAPWARWLYWLVLLLMIGSLALAASVHVDTSASGSALVNAREGTFVALLPAAISSDLERGRPLYLQLHDLPGRESITARALRVEAADAADVRRVGFSSLLQPSVLVTGVLASDGLEGARLPSSPRLRAKAVVVLRRERVLTVLLRGLEGVL